MNVSQRIEIVVMIGFALASPVHGEECFTPLDKTPGWKKVALLSAAPWLAAVGVNNQFRSGEVALIWAEGGVGYRGSTRPAPGRMDYTLLLIDDRVRQLEVEFDRDLEGDKLDAKGWAGVDFPLSHHQRQNGAHIFLNWTAPAFASVTLTLHHHLHHAPLLRRVRGAFTAVVTQEDWLPAAFRGERALYYLQPEGAAVTLCLAPNQSLTVERNAVRGTPSPVAIVPR